MRVGDVWFFQCPHYSWLFLEVAAMARTTASSTRLMRQRLRKMVIELNYQEERRALQQALLWTKRRREEMESGIVPVEPMGLVSGVQRVGHMTQGLDKVTSRE